jgi:hypothetical protein
MSQILLTLVVQNSKFSDEAQVIKSALLNLLGEKCKFISLTEYHKFENSFMLDFSINYSLGTAKEFLLYEMTRISSLIARPWLIYFSEDNSTELIFNKSDATQFTQENFNPIIWGHIQKGQA